MPYFNPKAEFSVLPSVKLSHSLAAIEFPGTALRLSVLAGDKLREQLRRDEIETADLLLS